MLHTTDGDLRKSVLETHNRLLDAEMRFLESARIAAPSNHWQGALLTLAARAIGLQRAIHDGATLGYSDDELAPVARAMLSSMVTLAYIGRGRSAREREARTLAWLVNQRKSRDRLHEYLWRSRWSKKADLEHEAQSTNDAERAMLEEAARRGVAPSPKVGKRDSWTGLTDYEMFKRTGYVRLYRHYYALWSDDSHAGPTSVNSLVGQSRAGQFTIGPRSLSPWFLLYAVAQVGAHAIAQINKVYRLRRDTEIQTLWQRAQTEFEACMPKAP